jgi:serine/threonine protein kinase/tetratricopeptide (TPR) repeat protein
VEGAIAFPLIVANADRIIELLHAAKGMAAGAEREQFVAQACRDDEELKEQIVSLLKADAEEGDSDFLKLTRIVRPSTPPSEKPGDRIGRYKLLEQIGEGGCGVVYMAEQEKPVRRRVALKVIKLGMDTKQVVARFEAERQALAMMEHPNIAKVLDGGATETGRPFFVMELVRGIKITEYCDQNNLSTNERLELFIQVCQAIQHAHQKGIIHRDIKPSNILVTLHDDVAVPKVIDFGIAKATVGQLTEKTVFTAFAQFIGTPAYMSPEQAQMSGLDIDTRADIYSLGVLLYELLTGNTPFDAKGLLAAGMDEMRRKIREDEPAKPSTCLSTMQVLDLTTVAKRRQVEPPKLIHLIRGDLDWLVMKCLEKDRTRRYETAGALVMDVQRHLSDEPVVACPPSNFYRFRKFVRRNKLVFAAASAVIAALIIGLSVSTCMFLKEKQARQRAVAAEREQAWLRRNAEADAVESRRLATFLGELSQTLGQEGNATKVESTYRVALAMWMRLLTKDHPEMADALAALAEVFQRGKPASADMKAHEAAQKCHGAMPEFEKLAADRNQHYESWFIAVAYKSLGILFQESGQSGEAEKAYRDTLVLWRKLATDSNQEDDRWQLAHNYECLGGVLSQTGRAKDSVEAYRAAQVILIRLVSEFNTDDRRLHLAGNYDSLGRLLKEAGRPTESLEAFRNAQAIWLKLVAALNTEGRRWQLAMNWDALAQLLTEMGKFDEAIEAYRQAVAVWKNLVADFNKIDSRNHLSGTLISFAGTLQVAARRAESEELFREAESAIREDLALRRQRFGEVHREVDGALCSLASVLQKAGKLAEAETVWREELALERKLSGDKHVFVANSLASLARVLRDQGMLAEAERTFREELDLLGKLPFAEATQVATALAELTSTLLAEQKFAEAESPARECLIIREKKRPDDWSTFNAWSKVGCSLLGQKKYAEAEPLLLAGYEGMKQREGKIPPNGKIRLQESIQRLVQLYEVTGQSEKVAEWSGKLAEFETKAK